MNPAPPSARSRPRAIRVLHVITRLVHGGAQENTILTAHRLRERGFEPLIVTGPADGPEGSLEPLCARLGVPLRLIPDLVRNPSPARDLKAFFKLLGILRRERFDIVHTHTSKAGFVGRLAARIARVPRIVHTPHGHIFHDYYGMFRTSIYIMMERLAAQSCDRILTLSRREAVEHLELAIGSPAQFVHVPSGIDFARFDSTPSRGDARMSLGLPPDAFVAGSVGRLAPVKGHKYLIEAASRLQASIPELRVVLAGDGELRDELSSLTRSLGLGDRVHFAGLVPDVTSVLPAFDVAVFPSVNEGMGRAIAEAMRCGIPVVATAVGGVPELLDHGDAGMLVPSRSAGAVAAAILSLHANPGARSALAEKGLKHVSTEYGLDEMLRRIEAVYRDVVRNR